jgi:hypothetical protein
MYLPTKGKAQQFKYVAALNMLQRPCLDQLPRRSGRGTFGEMALDPF